MPPCATLSGIAAHRLDGPDLLFALSRALAGAGPGAVPDDAPADVRGDAGRTGALLQAAATVANPDHELAGTSVRT